MKNQMDSVLSGEAVYGQDGLLSRVAEARNRLLDRSTFELVLPSDTDDSAAHQRRTMAVRQTLNLITYPGLRTGFLVVYAMLHTSRRFPELFRYGQYFHAIRKEVVGKRKLGHLDFGHIMQPSTVGVDAGNQAHFESLCQGIEQFMHLMGPSIDRLAFAGCDVPWTQWPRQVNAVIHDFLGEEYQSLPQALLEWQQKLTANTRIRNAVHTSAKRWYPTNRENRDKLSQITYDELFVKGISNADLWLDRAHNYQGGRLAKQDKVLIRKTHEPRGTQTDISSLDGALEEHIPKVIVRATPKMKKPDGYCLRSIESYEEPVTGDSASATMMAEASRLMPKLTSVLSKEERLVLWYCLYIYGKLREHSIDFAKIARRLNKLRDQGFFESEKLDATLVQQMLQAAIGKAREYMQRNGLGNGL